MTIKILINRIRRIIVDKSNSDRKIKYFRAQGMKIGTNCIIETMSFSTEPYLIEIGNEVGISNGTVFITHDAGIRCFKEELPGDDIFGKIVVGNNVFIGINCTLLPNTRIGNNCIIGAGSVVRGKFPDNSVIVGNPAKVFGSMSVQKMIYRQNSGRLKTADMTDEKKRPFVIKHFT